MKLRSVAELGSSEKRPSDFRESRSELRIVSEFGSTLSSWGMELLFLEFTNPLSCMRRIGESNNPTCQNSLRARVCPCIKGIKVGCLVLGNVKFEFEWVRGKPTAASQPRHEASGGEPAAASQRSPEEAWQADCGKPTVVLRPTAASRQRQANNLPVLHFQIE